MQVPDPLRSAALARPDHPAVAVFEGATRTWGALDLAVGRRASALLDQGVGPGALVALCGPSSMAWVVELFALWRVGAAVAPLSSRGTVPELRRGLRSAAPTFVTAPEPTRLSREQRGTLATTGAARLLVPGLGAEPAPERPWPLDEVRLVILTSGTTRAPQPVRITGGQLVFSAFGSAIRLGHHLHDRWLACLPLAHIGGLMILVRCAWYATTVELHPSFAPDVVAARLSGGAVTQISLSPAMLAAVLDAGDFVRAPARVRSILIGGAAASEALLDRARAIGLPVARTWGMSEAASQISTGFAGALDPAEGSGPPLAFARVETTAEGALAVTGPVVGGRLVTRDLGQVDARGRVHVQGRLDDVIVSGGVNLSPAEIERALSTHPAVLEAAVVGVPSGRWGHRPVALLVADGPPPSDAALQAWCRARLTAYKVPDAFHWFDALPRGPLGKRSRSRLRGLLGDQPQPVAGRLERGGPLGGAEVGEADEDVLERERSAQVLGVVGPTDAVGERHRSLGPALHGELDDERVGAADGPAVVGLHVHEGHAPRTAVEGRGPVEGRVDERLEGLVGVVEIPPKEHNPAAIHFVEPRRDLVIERHDSPRKDC
jgi:O-succinylbenzoic acid--CoA ligase